MNERVVLGCVAVLAVLGLFAMSSSTNTLPMPMSSCGVVRHVKYLPPADPGPGAIQVELSGETRVFVGPFKGADVVPGRLTKLTDLNIGTLVEIPTTCSTS